MIFITIMDIYNFLVQSLETGLVSSCNLDLDTYPVNKSQVV